MHVLHHAAKIYAIPLGNSQKAKHVNTGSEKHVTNTMENVYNKTNGEPVLSVLHIRAR